jgi:hypothetical protein
MSEALPAVREACADAEVVDGEEFTNKIPDVETRLGRKAADQADVADSPGVQAFRSNNCQPFSALPQGLVNHVGKAPVNHAARCGAGDVGLTSLFKPKRKSPGYGLACRPGT